MTAQPVPRSKPSGRAPARTDPARLAVRQLPADAGGRGSDAVQVLRWGLSRYAWLFLLPVLLLALLIPAAAARAPENYDAEALVVAQRLDMDLVALPRFGAAVFGNGEVARAVATRLGSEAGLADIVPERVSLVAEQDSIVLRVVGHGESPEIAADVANAAAATFLVGLNAPGEGVGAFTLQSRALPPTIASDPLPSLRFLLPVGLLAGGSLGLAALGLLLAVRRPVLQAEDAEQVTGFPVLATVTLPSGRGSGEAGTAVGGLAPFCRRLLDLETDTVILVSAPSAGTVRRRLTAATAQVLEQVCDLRQGPDAMAASAARGAVAAVDGAVAPEQDGSGLRPVRDSLMLFETAEPLDLVLVAEHSTTVLVVVQGTSAHRLRGAAQDYLGGGPAALVLVRHARRRKRLDLGRPRPHADEEQGGAAEPPVVRSWGVTERP